jgi:hypothetical protein
MCFVYFSVEYKCMVLYRRVEVIFCESALFFNSL